MTQPTEPVEVTQADIDAAWVAWDDGPTVPPGMPWKHIQYIKQGFDAGFRAGRSFAPTEPAPPARSYDLAELTRPLIGIEYRTVEEVFDIMCDRIKRGLGATAIRNLTGDEA